MSYLDAIVKRKWKEVEVLPPCPYERSGPVISLQKALDGGALAVIAEIKRRSPSAGSLAPIADPCALATVYEQAGAAAISVLTDGEGFGGSFEDLLAVSQRVSIPCLCKEFIVHTRQLEWAYGCGASAVLLIARVLGEELFSMLEEVEALGLEALVEVHDASDLRLALEAGASIVGVNSRDLSSFHLDLERAKALAPSIPSTVMKVAESGIRRLEDAQEMAEAGYDAVLVGQALVQSGNPDTLIKEMRACRCSR